MSSITPIRVFAERIAANELRMYVGQPFPDLVKFVVDLDRRVIAIGGELHADAEGVLLEQGSRQASLWGGNYHPGVGEGECIEYESLINIRPNQGNTSMFVQDAATRARIRDLVFEIVGRGESLA